MLNADEFWRVAGQVASERGGLVVGFARDSEQPELGSSLDNVLGFVPPAPATVISRSDWSDWKEQVEAFYGLRPGWGRGKGGDPDATYYRVRFDKFPVPAGFRSGSLFSTSSPLSSTLSVPSFAGYAAPVRGLQGVTFFPRALARVIDLFVHYLATYLAGLLFVWILIIAAGGRPPAWVVQKLSHGSFIGFVAGIAGLFAYHVICTTVDGSTLGKSILAMQVLQEDGSPCGPKSAIIRELGFFVDGLFFGLVAYGAMRDDPQQKRLGDGWADTMVSKRADVPSASRRGGMRFVLALIIGIAVDIALVMTALLIQMNR